MQFTKKAAFSTQTVHYLSILKYFTVYKIWCIGYTNCTLPEHTNILYCLQNMLHWIHKLYTTWAYQYILLFTKYTALGTQSVHYLCLPISCAVYQIGCIKYTNCTLPEHTNKLCCLPNRQPQVHKLHNTRAYQCAVMFTKWAVLGTHIVQILSILIYCNVYQMCCIKHTNCTLPKHTNIL